MSESIVSLENVTIYQEKNMVLNNVNLTVNRGDFIYMIGNY
jgi:cell division transport system ATP-binding protein